MNKAEVESMKKEFQKEFEKMEKAIKPLRLQWRFYDVLASLFKDKTFWKRYGLDEYIE